MDGQMDEWVKRQMNSQLRRWADNARWRQAKRETETRDNDRKKGLMEENERK